MKKGEAFDLSSGCLLTFLSMFTRRAKEWGWNLPVLGILNILKDANNPNSPTVGKLQIDQHATHQGVQANVHPHPRAHGTGHRDDEQLPPGKPDGRCTGESDVS
jgi:hypothetical protein